MNKDRLHQCAAAFASALDREDYAAARTLMADDCTYNFRGEVIESADDIIASYQSHGEDARKKFDQVAYESEVEITGEDSATLHYTDRVTHRGETLVHRCQQHIEFDEHGLIRRVTHEDLPGEAERLAEFKRRHR